MAAKTTGADEADVSWVETGTDYQLALKGSRLIARNAKGKVLSSVPKQVKDSEAAENLRALRDWLKRHEDECRAKVEEWMLGSLPVATRALAAVWEDPAWRSALNDAVISPLDDDGRPTRGVVGFLKAADGERGLGVVDLDGETAWFDADAMVIPHPVVLDDLDELRAFGMELGIEQGVTQLMREVHRRPDDVDRNGDGTRLSDFANGEFKELRHVLSRCQSLGFAVRGGYAACRVFEGGRSVEARYWVGADEPSAPTWTGELVWVDESERTIALDDVGPVAWSEGVRMASLLYANRVVAEEAP
jgi:hypothetical protein